jgi:hypothetical protein
LVINSDVDPERLGMLAKPVDTVKRSNFGEFVECHGDIDSEKKRTEKDNRFAPFLGALLT